VVLAFLLGVANAFDAPTRQAFVIEMVGRDSLPNAIVLNSTMFNMAIALGPAAGGLAYASFGPALCFTLNGLTYAVVIYALLKMKIIPLPKPVSKPKVLGSLVEGMRYIAANKTILSLSVMVSVIGIFGISLVTLLPAWSVKILKGDATTNGFLMAARGSGAFLGALLLASLGKISHKGRILTAGTFVFPIALFLFSFSRGIGLSILFLIGLGVAQIAILNLMNILIQELTSDEYRGRVMSFYMFTFFGFMPVGSLFMGMIAERAGLPFAFTLGAAACLFMSSYVWIKKPRIRRL
jgi:predicted MFS family arabinose efflux permease